MSKKFLVFISVLAIFYNSKAQVKVQDSLALVELYNSTEGANWKTTWNLSQPISTWSGVTVRDGRVIKLHLYSNQLSGIIPIELGNLTKLTILNLYNNQLSGTIPIELSNLTNLTRLDLYVNRLSGTIPIELGNLTNLTRLDLHVNRLSGSIPIELGNLTNLTTLSLSYNELIGSIPIELGNLTKLTELYLLCDKLSGSVPRELGKLTNLTALSLRSNELSGSIPVEFRKLSNLTRLYLDDNQFDQFPNLSSLDPSSFRIQNNHFDFGDILPNKINGTYNYSPQAEVREGQRYEVAVGGSFNLSVQVGGAGNTYQWYKNNNQITGAIDATLSLTGIQMDDLGNYHCRIKNPDLPLLTLRSGIDIVEVTSTSSSSNSRISIPEEELEELQNFEQDFEVAIYPNPAVDHITMSVSGLAEGNRFSYRLYDSFGKMLLSGNNLAPSSYRLDLVDIAIGLHILEIVSQSGEMKHIKVLIDK